MHFKLSIYFVSILLLTFPPSHSATIQQGDLLISEVMANPFAVSDVNGEWFELFNTSANTIDLNGFIISDNNSNSHEINASRPLTIASGEYFVLGRNSDSATNGGVNLDYAYTGFSLGNTSDQIIVSLSETEITRIEYNGLPFGSAGISAELIAQVSQPDASHYQLTENFIYGAGDMGTPGEQGSFQLRSASPVPIPGAFWLFVSAIFLLSRNISVHVNSYLTSTIFLFHKIFKPAIEN